MYHAVQTLQISKLLCHHCGKTFLRDGTFKLYIRMHNFTEGKLVSGKIFQACRCPQNKNVETNLLIYIYDTSRLPISGNQNKLAHLVQSFGWPHKTYIRGISCLELPQWVKSCGEGWGELRKCIEKIQCVLLFIQKYAISGTDYLRR